MVGNIMTLFKLMKWLWRIVGPAADLKTHRKVVYDNVTNHVTIKNLW